MRAAFEKIDTGEAASFAVLQIEQASFCAEWHYHPECELTYIMEGSGERFVGDSMEAFGVGDLIWLGAELPHFWRSRKQVEGERSRALVVHFKEDFVGEKMQNLAEFARYRDVLLLAKRGLCFSGNRELTEGIGRRLTKLAQTSGLKRLRLWLEVLDVLLDESGSARLLSSPEHVALLDHKAGQRIHRAYEYVYANLAEGVRLDAVAEVAGMSPAAFSRYFKRMTGKNLSHFIGELRISQACKLLLESHLGVAEVAYEVGFGSLSNFNRLFKELKGVSPRVWRGGGN